MNLVKLKARNQVLVALQVDNLLLPQNITKQLFVKNITILYISCYKLGDGVNFMVQDSANIIGIIGVVIGVFLGFLLNIFKEWYNNRNNTKSIQKLIKSEIDHNIKLLKIFINDVNKLSKDKSPMVEYFPLPPLNNKMYSKFALSIPNTLEFKKIYEFYRFLDDLEFKYNKMITILSQDHDITFIPVDPRKPSVTRPGGMPRSDQDLIKELWNEFEEIIINLINEGNPIKK